MCNFKALLIYTPLLLSVLLSACDSSSSGGQPTPPEPPPEPEPEYLPVPEPSIEAPPDEGDIALISTFFDFAEVGFVQEEFFLSGTASSFTNLNELGTDGRWEAEPAATADYRPGWWFIDQKMKPISVARSWWSGST